MMEIIKNNKNSFTYMDGNTKVTIKNDYSVGKSQEDIQKALDEIAKIYSENFNVDCKIVYRKE